MFRIQTSLLFEVKENVKMSDLRNQARFEGRLKMEIQNPNVEKKTSRQYMMATHKTIDESNTP